MAGSPGISPPLLHFNRVLLPPVAWPCFLETIKLYLIAINTQGLGCGDPHQRDGSAHIRILLPTPKS